MPTRGRWVTDVNWTQAVIHYCEVWLLVSIDWNNIFHDLSDDSSWSSGQWHMRSVCNEIQLWYCVIVWNCFCFPWGQVGSLCKQNKRSVFSKRESVRDICALRVCSLSRWIHGAAELLHMISASFPFYVTMSLSLVFVFLNHHLLLVLNWLLKSTLYRLF